MLGGMKSWLLLLVQSSFPPTSTGRILCQSDSDTQQIRACAWVRFTMPYCVATPALASYYFICHVHTPQPGFCYIQLYFLLL